MITLLGGTLGEMMMAGSVIPKNLKDSDLFYTNGMVANQEGACFKVESVLIDPGSGVSLISQPALEALKLQSFSIMNCVIEVVDGRETKL